ncbi:MAG: hypothetical protein DRP00_00405 [Candidatus Aenigmatarchaeota archaeon]|nr:MAG: hypothetical protein DRP00_00405 [Candidatus Aenigmarchaeota archaeon]
MVGGDTMTRSLLDLFCKRATASDIDIIEMLAALYFTVRLDVVVRQLEYIIEEIDKAELSETAIETIRQTLLETSEDERIKQAIKQLFRQK